MRIFLELDEGIYIDSEKVVLIKLIQQEGAFCWEFHLEGVTYPVYSRKFSDKREAVRWLEDVSANCDFLIEYTEYRKLDRGSKEKSLTSRRLLERFLEGSLLAVFGALFVGTLLGVVALLILVGIESAKKLVELVLELFA